MTDTQWLRQRRLEEMHALLAYLATRGEVTAGQLRGGTELRLAVERALSQLVDHATSINAHIHEDVRVDLEQVASAVPAAVGDFGEYVRQVARFLPGPGPGARAAESR
jgi:hypothetical protein